MVSLRLWWIQILVGIDQLVNALLAGWADETLSARAWRCRDKPVGRIATLIINGIFFWQQNHCKKAYDSERLRQQLPSYYRKHYL